jgi:DNA-directed RNA polymerase specialized sigma24 family protein
MRAGGDITTEDDQAAPRRAGRALTEEAFNKLLGRLDPNRERAGHKYREIHTNLVRFFRWRGCPFPEDHADETLNRVAGKLERGQGIDDPQTYCIGVARMLVLEIRKRHDREQAALADAGPGVSSAAADEGADASPARAECFRRCLQTLPPESRELIVNYYRGERRAKIENRKALAGRLGVSLNTLRMQALRLRERLKDCVEECVRGRSV